MRKPIQFIVLVALISFSFSVKATEAENTALTTNLFVNEVLTASPTLDSNQSFFISYWLDTDGKPYIISIASNDKEMTQWVQKRLHLNNISEFQDKQGWYNISVLYENIY